MSLKIRKATEKDYEAVLGLVRELAIFQNAADKLVNTVEQMKADQQYFNCLVAETDAEEIVGIASYFFAYYTWVGKSLYLDDLCVKESFRGNKAGSMLLEELFNIAKQENCKRVRWQVSDWNTRALSFYKKCGAEVDVECCNCDFDQVAIQQFHIP
jgi:ribosomal protein S18 acetylase RimI-like enzyme